MEYKLLENGTLEFYNNNELQLEISEDKYNSEVFGMKMGNIHFHMDPVELKFVLKKAKEQGFDHLSTKIDTGAKTLIHLLEQNQFLLMDTLVTYKFDFSKKTLKEMNHNCLLRDCIESDLSEVKNFTSKAFKIDRFHSDKTLEKSKSDLYYSKWFENSFNGLADRVIVGEIDGDPVGFTAWKLTKMNDETKTARLVLSAVSDNSRGKRVYTSMIHEGLKWLEGKADYVLVGTQIDNYPVQKTWANFGSFLIGSNYVFHKKL